MEQSLSGKALWYRTHRLRQAGRCGRRQFSKGLEREPLSTRRTPDGRARWGECRRARYCGAQSGVAGCLLLHRLFERARWEARACGKVLRWSAISDTATLARNLTSASTTRATIWPCAKAVRRSFSTHRSRPTSSEDGVDCVIVSGCNTSGCVRRVQGRAFSYGFRVIVPEPCCGDVDEGPHRANLRDVERRYADVVGLEEVLAYIETSGRRNS